MLSEYQPLLYSPLVDGNIGSNYVPVKTVQLKIVTTTDSRELYICRNEQGELILFLSFFTYARRYIDLLNVRQFVFGMHFEGICNIACDHNAL